MVAAVEVLKEHQPGIYLLAWVVGYTGIQRFACVYAYFRWADDVVDASDANPQALALFAARQQYWISSSELTGPERRPEESWLRAALTEDPTLYKAVMAMWKALEFDIHRKAGQRCSGEDIDQQIYRIGDAFAEGLHQCFGTGPTPRRLKAMCRAATALHQLRDRKEDDIRGFSNIPAEVRPEQELAWMRARADVAQVTLRAGLGIEGQEQSWGYRLLIFFLCRSYLRHVPAF